MKPINKAKEEVEMERWYNLDMMARHGQIPLSPITPFIQGTLSWDKLCPAYKELHWIEEYLTTFERLCEVHNVPEDKKVHTLTAKHSGEALNVFKEMPIDEALKYPDFLQALLQRFKSPLKCIG